MDKILKNRQKIKKLEKDIYKTEKELAKEMLTKKNIKKGDRVYIKSWKKYGYFEEIQSIEVSKTGKLKVYLSITEVDSKGENIWYLNYIPIELKYVKRYYKKFTKKHATNYKRVRTCDCVGWCNCRD